MRVCHLVHDLTLGGLENQLLRIIEAAPDDIDFVVCYFGDDHSLRAEMEGAGVRVVQLEAGSGDPVQNLLPWSLWRFNRFLQGEQFDILHAHGSAYLHVVGRLCALGTGTDVVGTYHNTAENFNRGMLVLERATRPLSAVNIAVSEGVEQTFAGSSSVYPPADGLERLTYTIYNGIDVEAFAGSVAAADGPGLRSELGLSETDLVFLSIGRYSHEKNQRLLVEAMADVVEETPEARLVLVGWGDLEADLRRTAEREGISDHVTVTGRVPSVPEYYAMADVFVLPSLTEGLSVVLLESMSAGLPVIGTDVAGTGEAVVDGETGLVVEPDSKSALVDAMCRLSDRDLRRKMGFKGRKRVEETFSIERTAELYADVYRRLQ
jgi:glycosyltransferase involved in cell wall biosynthesis